LKCNPGTLRSAHSCKVAPISIRASITWKSEACIRRTNRTRSERRSGRKGKCCKDRLPDTIGARRGCAFSLRSRLGERQTQNSMRPGASRSGYRRRDGGGKTARTSVRVANTMRGREVNPSIGRHALRPASPTRPPLVVDQATSSRMQAYRAMWLAALIRRLVYR